MAGDLQPLQSYVPIAKPDGTPTDYFIKWAQQRQIDITESVTAAQAVALIEAWSAEREVIAGVGLDGGGPLSSDVTLDANVQTILNLVSTTQGSVLYRGAADWAALAPGTSGHFLKTNGAGANPEWAAGGGGGGGNWWYQPPTAASFTLISGDATNLTLTDDTDEGLLVDMGAITTGPRQRVAYRTLTTPTGDWDLQARVVPTSDQTAVCNVGIMMYDSVGGRLASNNLVFNGATAPIIEVDYWTSLTAFSSAPASFNTRISVPSFLRMTKVGTTLTCYISSNGKQWLQLFTASITAHLANNPNRVGIFSSYNKSAGLRTLFSVPYFTLTGSAV